MLSTVLTSLQTLTSTRFIVGSFFPTLTFWFSNAYMLFLLCPLFQAWVKGYDGKSVGFNAVLLCAALIGTAMFAYGLSALLPAIQAVLEGSNWPMSLVHFFLPAQMRQLERIDRALDRNATLRGPLGMTASGKTQAELLQETLTQARQVGAARTTNTYKGAEPSAKRVARLAADRRAGRAISFADLNTAVATLAVDLRNNNADAGAPGNPLETARADLWRLIDYAQDYAASEFRQLKTTRHFTFGSVPLAPTRMGNVARSVQYYALRRYNLNFEVFWSRLQLPVQRDKEFGPMLQAARTQLEFLVSSSALTLLWGWGWSAYLIYARGSARLFLTTALAAPAVAYLLYRVAVAHYRTVADLLRSAIDLFRFDLLRALNHTCPDGVLEEQQLWETLDALHGLFEPWDLRQVASKTP